jgi:hypothetical protein
MLKFKNPFKHEQTFEEAILEGMVLSRAMLEPCNGFDQSNPRCRDLNGCMGCPRTASVIRAFKKGMC